MKIQQQRQKIQCKSRNDKVGREVVYERSSVEWMNSEKRDNSNKQKQQAQMD